MRYESPQELSKHERQNALATLVGLLFIALLAVIA